MDNGIVTENTVQLFVSGRFGEVVQEHLLKCRDDVQCWAVSDDRLRALLSFPRPAKMLAFVAWRPDPSRCELLDRIAHNSELPFVPLTIDTGKLQLGPVVVPGRGPCWTCWAQRSRENSAWPIAREALLDFYDTHPKVDRRVSNHRCGRCLKNGAGDHFPRQRTRSSRPCLAIRFITRQIHTFTVVGRHDCQRCGLHRSPQTRSIDFISQELTWLWKEQAVIRRQGAPPIRFSLGGQ